MNDQHLPSDQPSRLQPPVALPPSSSAACDPQVLTRAQQLAWDACRGEGDAYRGESDVAAAELAPLADLLAENERWRAAFARAQRHDNRVQAALHDAEVPAGLEARILARLAARTNEPAPVLDATAQTSAAVMPLSRQVTLSRRRAVAGVLALAASLLFAFFYFYPRPAPDLTLDAVQELARSTFLEEQTLALAGSSHLPGTPLKVAQPADPAFAFPNGLRRGADLRWREVAGFLGRDGVAYDWTSHHGRRATLYVVPLTPGRGQPNIPPVNRAWPPRRALATQGQASAVWSAQDCLFVLVVEGNERDYQSLLVPSRQAA